MKKYAKIVNEETKQCEVGLGTNNAFYESIGMEETDIEQAYDGNWYLEGHTPKRPELSYVEKRLAEYPSFSDQLDMIYWDKINATNKWLEMISQIKTKYPKE